MLYGYLNINAAYLNNNRNYNGIPYEHTLQIEHTQANMFS